MSRSQAGQTLTYAGKQHGQTGLIVKRLVGANGTQAIQIQLGEDYPVPDKQLFADYVDLRVENNGVRIVWGKRDTFSSATESKLHHALEIVFPYSQFVHQLAASVTNTNPGTGLSFAQAVEASVEKGGYPKIDTLPVAIGAEKQAHARANSASMFVFTDDVCVDFLYLDARSLSRASAGKKLDDVEGVVRVVMAPNLLDYFVRQAIKIADGLRARIPAAFVEDHHDA